MNTAKETSPSSQKKKDEDDFHFSLANTCFIIWKTGYYEQEAVPYTVYAVLFPSVIRANASFYICLFSTTYALWNRYLIVFPNCYHYPS